MGDGNFDFLIFAINCSRYDEFFGCERYVCTTTVFIFMLFVVYCLNGGAARKLCKISTFYFAFYVFLNKARPVGSIAKFRIGFTYVVQKSVFVGFVGKATFRAIKGVFILDFDCEFFFAVGTYIEDVFKPFYIVSVKIFRFVFFLLVVCVKIKRFMYDFANFLVCEVCKIFFIDYLVNVEIGFSRADFTAPFRCT